MVGRLKQSQRNSYPFPLLTPHSFWLGGRCCFAKNTFQRFYLIDKRHISLETDMDGMSLIGDNIPSLGNQELLVRLIFGIGMAFAESFSSQKRDAFNCMKRS